MSLPSLLLWADIHSRLLLIFPTGAPRQAVCTREMAAKTTFVMLYIGAVEGRDMYLAPKHVCRMSDEQAGMDSEAARLSYDREVRKPGSTPRGQPWYADNTREPIRDETLRQGLVSVGAAVVNRSVPTTSPKGRYQLTADFAALFEPSLDGDELLEAIEKWREDNLSTTALARVALVQAGASVNPDDYVVTFPNGETQRLSPGESSVITKAVIERFAARFLEKPHVLWVSESGNKVVARHDIQAKMLGLNLDASRLLPDTILVDLSDHMVVVFVEVVSTDGPITEDRRTELLKLTSDAGIDEKHIAFVTAFMDRSSSAFKKTLAELAWNSFVWIASEPEGLIAFERGNSGDTWLHKRLSST